MKIKLELSGVYPIVLFWAVNEEIHLKHLVQNMVHDKGSKKVNSCYLMIISIGMETTEDIQEIFGGKNE